MLNKLLERRLRRDLIEARAFAAKTLQLADEANARGDCREYFARSSLGSLPELLWVLEQSDDARFYFRLRAEREIEQRSWYEANDRSFPIDADLVGETEVYLRGGLLDRAHDFLERAWRCETSQAAPYSTGLRRLALAAAQLGRRDLAHLSEEAAQIDTAWFRRCRDPIRRAAEYMLQVSPAEVAYLLGDYAECRERVDKVLEAEGITRPQRICLGRNYLDRQTGVSLQFAKAHGLDQAMRLVEPRHRHIETYEHALQYFERAISLADRLGDLPWQGYQARLYARLARDLFEGRKPNPNPFATASATSNDPCTAG